MKARINPGYDRDRQRLAEIVPLATPFTLFVTPAQVCNFRCRYCTQSLTAKEKEERGFRPVMQDYDVFLKIARQASAFPGRFKRVLLTGLGEPLMNPRTPDMVEELRGLGVADHYEIFTNASLLTHEMSERLIRAGLTCLRISIQGVTAEKYRETTGRNVDIDGLVENIGYFFRNRGDCRVYVKIIDACLESEDDKDRFFALFGNVCDDIFIEHLTRAQPMMGDYEGRANSVMTFYGEEARKRDVCPYMFYTLQTDALGEVFPCPPLGLPSGFSLGNVADTPLLDIWNGSRLRMLRMTHLRKGRQTIDACRRCEGHMCFTPEEDNLDLHADEIARKLEAGV
jgi:MoaA/NifB/PqqE/SkfB family radical SAM enzyme